MRLVAALTAVLLAASGVAACPKSPLPVAKACCKVRCQHEVTRSIARCCCAADSAPVAKGTPPQAKPPLPASSLASATALPQAPHLGVALTALGSHAPPGRPLFLQRCALIL